MTNIFDFLTRKKTMSNDDTNILDFPKKIETLYVKVPSRPRKIQDGYTIGPADAPFVCTLKITCDQTTTTLTLNEQGVRQMIRLLDATLEADEEHDDDGPVQA
jgi:hypothetical protein